MRLKLRQRAGSGIAAVGLSLLATAGAFTVAAPANAVEQTSPVCNNIHAGEDPATCHTGGPYGDVDWEVAGDELVLHVTGAEGMGWSDLRVCAPYAPPATSADCQPNDAGLLATDDYIVEMTSPSGATASGEDGKTYKFEPCGTEFVVRVPTSAIGAGSSEWWWAIHLAPGGCAGGATGTHEAFGRVPAATNENPGGENENPGGGNENPGGGNENPGGGNETPGNENQVPGGGNETPGGGNETVAGETVTTGGQQEGTKAVLPVTGDQPSTKPQTEVIGERFDNPAPAVQPQVTATLPVTGAPTMDLIALAGIALLLGGLAIRFGRPATQH